MSDPDPQHVFRFDFIACPWGGGMYLLPCPGRQGLDDSGRLWRRNLEQDLDVLAQHKIDALVTLLPEHEMQHYHVSDLPHAVARRGWRWWHWPVTDMAVAEQSVLAEIQHAVPLLRQTWQNGGAIALHCAAGLGRTGTLAAQLLVLQGVSPEQAMLMVRKTRPGAIETPAQEQAVKQQKLLG